jgi:hypothetical protein
MRRDPVHERRVDRVGSLGRANDAAAAAGTQPPHHVDRDLEGRMPGAGDADPD